LGMCSIIPRAAFYNTLGNLSNRTRPVTIGNCLPRSLRKWKQILSAGVQATGLRRRGTRSGSGWEPGFTASS